MKPLNCTVEANQSGFSVLPRFQVKTSKDILAEGVMIMGHVEYILLDMLENQLPSVISVFYVVFLCLFQGMF